MVRHTGVSRMYAGIGVVVAAILGSACGSSSTSSSGSGSSTASGPSAQSKIAAEVPDAIKKLGPLQIATDATYAPDEFVDPNTGQISGWDVDFGKQVCAVMGLACDVSNVNFDDIIPQLTGTGKDSAGTSYAVRYQIAFSSFTPTMAREQAGIDFISYYKAGEAWIVKASGGPTVNSAKDLCGHKVAVETGTVEESDAWKLIGKNPDGSALSGASDQCPSGQDVKVDSFTSQTDANSALLSGRDEIGFLDSQVAAYQVKVVGGGQLKLSGQPCSVAPYGIAVAKSSGLDQALQDAVKYLIDNGFYSQVLNNYNATPGAITSADVKVNDNNTIGAACVS